MTDIDTPCIVSSWVQAIRELQHWYAHLDRVIQSLAHSSDEPQYPTKQQVIASLLGLRLELETDLQKLLSDIPSSPEADSLNRLNTHTKTILACVRKIQQALEKSGFGNPM